MEKNPKQKFGLVRFSNLEQAVGDLQETACGSMLLPGPLQVKLAEAAAAKQGGKTQGRARPPWIGKDRTQGLLRISLVIKDGREVVKTEACLRFQ